MKLKYPITIIPPPIRLADGTEKPLNHIVLDELNFSILDDPSKKTVEVRFNFAPFGIILWTGYFYDKAGDYTQKDVENKILETLGNDIEQTLTKLFKQRVYSTNIVKPLSANNTQNMVPLSSRNILSTFYSQFSSNSAYKLNPYGFLMQIPSIAPIITASFVKQNTNNIESYTFTTRVSSVSGN
jgi:hypothetical protein